MLWGLAALGGVAGTWAAGTLVARAGGHGVSAEPPSPAACQFGPAVCANFALPANSPPARVSPTDVPTPSLTEAPAVVN